jgi:aspartyl-tRNA(Asn)/glutamyl-tRNA(Gln) amidotransferase subunit C
MKVTKDEVYYIAKLANLHFTEEEAQKMSEEFSGILTHFDNINKEDLNGLEMYSFDDKPLRLRKDETHPFENSKNLFTNTKKMRDTAIEIPKVVE